MTTGTRKVKVVLDTNILISSIGFGGKPRKILELILDNKVIAVSSPILLAELEDVIYKRFPELTGNFRKIKKQIKKSFMLVRPNIVINVARDTTDNRVLEAAAKARCQYIITGDKDLLDVKVYKKIQILTPAEFLILLKN